MGDPRTASFLRVLDPEDNSTGGGSASAVAGAMAAALAAMVARLSAGGTAGGPDPLPDADYAALAEAGARLSEELRAGADEDAAAFDAVMDAYRLPKASDEEKAARSAAIRSAMAAATFVPLMNAERCAEALRLVGELEGHSNPRALSDLQSARYLAEAGLRGCLANVEINLPGVKDEGAAAEIRERARVVSALA